MTQKQPETDSTNFSVPKLKNHFVEKGKEFGRRAAEIVKPEYEYLFGAYVAIFYASVLATPENISQLPPNLVQAIKEDPSAQAAVAQLVSVGLILTTHGAMRFAFERFPFYKAYFQVFGAAFLKRHFPEEK